MTAKASSGSHKHMYVFSFSKLTFVTSRPLSTGRMPSAGRPSHISQPTLNVAQHGTTRSANLYSTQAEARCRRARASRVRWGMLGSELSDHSSRSRRYTQWSQMTRAFSSWRLHTSPPRACQQASLSCTCAGRMLSRHEVRSAYTMSDICMQHCACNGGKLPYTSIHLVADEGSAGRLAAIHLPRVCMYIQTG